MDILKEASRLSLALPSSVAVVDALALDCLTLSSMLELASSDLSTFLVTDDLEAGIRFSRVAVKASMLSLEISKKAEGGCVHSADVPTVLSFCVTMSETVNAAHGSYGNHLISLASCQETEKPQNG